MMGMLGQTLPLRLSLKQTRRFATWLATQLIQLRPSCFRSLMRTRGRTGISYIAKRQTVKEN
jgi:hypothetical protein